MTTLKVEAAYLAASERSRISPPPPTTSRGSVKTRRLHSAPWSPWSVSIHGEAVHAWSKRPT
jgi:hypothetical protein